MGHHISKQQNRQMSDEHQRMNRTKTHLEPTTSANQGKSISLAQKLKTKKYLKHQNEAKIGIGHIDKTAKRSANNLKKSQECSVGSVVITIRLLKMESNTKDIETMANMNALQSGSAVQLATDNSEKINNNEGDMNSMVVLNTTNISNDNDKHLNNNNNNLCQNIDEKTVQPITSNSLNGNSDFLSMINQTNEMNNKNSLSSVQCDKIKSLSENLNCDTISANISSLFDRPELLMPSDSEPGMDNVAEKSVNIEKTPTTTPTPTSISISASQQTALLAEPTVSQKTLRDFFPSGLISTVSPYPHHIPIANIVKSDCNNSDNSQHPAQSHHPKAHDNCFNKQTTSTQKDAKETKTKKPNWSIKFNCTKLKGSGSSANTTNEANESNSSANTTNFNCTSSSNEPTSQSAAALVLDKSTVFSTNGGNVFVVTMDQRQLDLARFTSDEYSIDEDCDKKARIQRAIEIAEGVEPPSGFISTKGIKSLHSMTTPSSQLVPNSVNLTNDTNGNTAGSRINAQQWHMLCSNPQTLRLLNDFHNLLQTTDEIPRIHSQVDFIHCLVPDLKQITNCSYYWGKMDRYEAERLLENKPEGTFLLRDSAQEEFLFSVSFRKYGRSLHARIEQFNHKFSFDAHDPGVYTANTVTGLLEHYKDPACVMFFEPALTLPLNRKFAYSLQQLCRATIVSHTTYDGINEICLPRKLKSYLKEYHYRQRVKVRRFDESNYGAT